ncbi:hypothetical protein GWI33_017299 [Rhynchophorus ferrugineus]|uniref:Uncharacterized protein n=1 Tax=Rhynchophorus ferrugineus TaxID=354439 RepID=A0A834M2J0_RHYFE|nr:hypothetical protein GWI33_017299 [Rhynchophorus ferrugineus]
MSRTEPVVQCFVDKTDFVTALFLDLCGQASIRYRITRRTNLVLFELDNCFYLGFISNPKKKYRPTKLKNNLTRV